MATEVTCARCWKVCGRGCYWRCYCGGDPANYWGGGWGLPFIPESHQGPHYVHRAISRCQAPEATEIARAALALPSAGEQEAGT